MPLHPIAESLVPLGPVASGTVIYTASLQVPVRAVSSKSLVHVSIPLCRCGCGPVILNMFPVIRTVLHEETSDMGAYPASGAHSHPGIFVRRWIVAAVPGRSLPQHCPMPPKQRKVQ